MLIDTHAHLDYPEYQADFDEVLDRAAQAGVTRIMTIGTSIEGSRRAVALASEHESIFATVGVHPTDLSDVGVDDVRPALRQICSAAAKVVAIGETGLDYHRLPKDMAEASRIQDRQHRLFRQQLELAADLKLNVVIHQRDAWEDTLRILREFAGSVRGVFHCFGGTPAQALEVAKLGHLVSFTGIITFKNAATVRESAQAVRSDGYMVETDCPYLAPAPYRGQRCEPWHTRLVAEEIARVRHRPLEEIAEATSRTAKAFFGLQ
jgi:TatD DNase family protein